MQLHRIFLASLFVAATSVAAYGDDYFYERRDLDHNLYERELDDGYELQAREIYEQGFEDGLRRRGLPKVAPKPKVAGGKKTGGDSSRSPSPMSHVITCQYHPGDEIPGHQYITLCEELCDCNGGKVACKDWKQNGQVVQPKAAVERNCKPVCSCT